MLCLFKAPYSVTGEDMCELYCHGNDFIVSKILESILLHCRLAHKGEFTLRSFLNKKIDLTQAEAIGNLLDAQTKETHKAAILQLEGKLYKRIVKILDKITDLRVILELAIDFVEDEVPDFNRNDILSRINSIIHDLVLLINTANEGIIIQNGLRIALVGPPNVGKSSIFNSLLEKDRSIISDIPGTTRDYLEESFTFNGYLINLIDTAGLHETKDFVELKGIEKTYEIIERADLILIIVNIPEASQIQHEIQDECLETCNSLNTMTQNYINEFKKENTTILKVINKVDLIEEYLRKKLIDSGFIPCSTIQKDGVEALKEALFSRFENIDVVIENGIITNTRQLVCVKKSYNNLIKAKEAFEKNLGIGFVTFDILQASNDLEEIIGNVSNNDILNKIFENFCIGK